MIWPNITIKIRCISVLMPLLFAAGAAAHPAGLCSVQAQQAANLEYHRAYDDCINGSNSSDDAPRCQSDWECSSGESCIENRCVIRPNCASAVRCDECFLGQRTCRVINCRGEITASFAEQCSATNTYACGACQDPSGSGGNGSRYTYPVFLENQTVSQSGPYGDLQACMDARATDPRCNGN